MTIQVQDSNPSLLSLAESILATTQSIVKHLKKTHQEQPNFLPSSPSAPVTTEYEALRSHLNTQALDLLRLVNGPKAEYRTLGTRHYDLAAHQIAFEFDYYGLVPLPGDGDGKIELQDLARKAKMDVDRTLRTMRFLCTQRIFREVEVEDSSSEHGEEEEIWFEHTAASAVIAREPLLKDTFLMQ
jgi:hypothetical protein